MTLDSDIERDFEIFEDFAILEDCELFGEPEYQHQRKRKVYKRRFNPYELNDKDFCELYCFDKETVTFIINLLNIEELKTKRGLPVSGSLQVLTALRFFGSNVYQSDIAELHGISQPTVSKFIAKITRKLALQLPNFVKFPSSSQEFQKTKLDFFQEAAFPGVIGTIDCTDICVKCPAKIMGEDPAEYKKGCYSLNVQIVCDAQCKITDIVARSKGSGHNECIWSTCTLKRRLDDSRKSHNGVLLGDAGYPLSYILFTPIKQPLTPQEEKYNKCLMATKNKTEHLNKQIKSKFRSIFERLKVDSGTAKNVILAVAVLHNIAKEKNMSIFGETVGISNDSDDDIMANSEEENILKREPMAAKIYRQKFINKHFI